MNRIGIYICLFGIISAACTVTKPVKTGEAAYQYKQYSVAVEMLEDEFDSSSNPDDQARKARYLAKSYDILEEYGKAIQWYDIADQLYGSELSGLELAQSLKKNERYSDASPIYDRLFRETNDFKYRMESQFCSQAAKDIERIDNFSIESMQFNSSNAEYSPVFFEEDFILFTSDRPGSAGSKEYKWTGRLTSDLWVTDYKGRQVYNFDALINSVSNEGSACFSKDFEEIFFTRCYSSEVRDQHCKLFYSQKPNGFWLEPEPLMFFDDLTNFGQPCLIENDSVLIFSASVNGSDNHDLYYSVKVGKAWSEAELMPSNINSQGDEKFPSSFGDSLFFASDGHLGYGGLDIFLSVLQDDGSWSDPVNMAWPINGGADDFGLIIKEDFDPDNMITLQGMFSSSRNVGFSTDVFSFTQYKLIEEEQAVEDLVEDEELTENHLVYLSIKVVENIYESDDPNEELIETSPVTEGVVDISSSLVKEEMDLNGEGRVLYKISDDSDHIIQVKTKEHLSSRIEVQIPAFDSLEKDTTLNIELALDRIVYDKEIIISNIYYDFNKWDIRDDAQAPLDSLYKILEINPQLDIELASHTDCRGEEDYNMDLSQKRAQSVMEYLITKGLEADRLSAVGYGESKLKIDCICEECSEEEHQANRRTSFKILKPE